MVVLVNETVNGEQPPVLSGVKPAVNWAKMPEVLKMGSKKIKVRAITCNAFLLNMKCENCN